MTNARLRELRDDQVMLVLTEFEKSEFNAKKTSEAFNLKMEKYGEEARITREQVYPVFRLAVQRAFVKITPPYSNALAQRVVDRYASDRGKDRFVVSDIRVSNSRGNLPYIASNGADVVLELLKGLRDKGKKDVHIGLGAGITSMFFAMSFAQVLRAEKDLPEIWFHALSASFDPLATECSPDTIFGRFQQSGLPLHYVGLPAQPFIKVREYKPWDQPGAKVAFDRKREIDIVVTSLASVEDDHGSMRRFIQLGSLKHVPRALGDIMYRQFGEKGALLERNGHRPVTLFEIEDLREHAAQDDKHSVLISGPCNECGKTRTKALKPLMSNPDLKVWTHLVCDLQTAEELVAR